MKILHLIHNYHPSIGGSQHLFRRLSAELVSRFGDEVTVVTSDALGEPRDVRTPRIDKPRESLDGVSVFRFKTMRRGHAVLRFCAKAARRMRLPFADLLALLYAGPISTGMLLAVIRSGADVVCATSFGYIHMLYPSIANRLRIRKPVVLYGALHIVDNHIDPVVLRAISRADAYVANTAFERGVLVQKGVPAEKIHIVGPGVDLEEYGDVDPVVARQRYGIGAGPVVAYIGRQAAGKGIDTLVESMASVWEQIPEATLLIAGGRGSFSQPLAEWLAALPPGSRSRVVVLDDFDEAEKPYLFAACDVLSMVSKFESFGIVYLEAWASGKPVIGSDAGAPGSVIDHGIDGLTVSYGSSADLARALVRLFLDDELRAALAREGRKKVEMNYTWEAVTTKLRAVYESVLPEDVAARLDARPLAGSRRG